MYVQFAGNGELLEQRKITWLTAKRKESREVSKAFRTTFAQDTSVVPEEEVELARG